MPFLLRIKCFIVTQNVDNLKVFCIFLAPFQKFIVLLQCSTYYKAAQEPQTIRWRYFYTLTETYNGIVPPWKSVMEIQPCRC